MTLPLPISRPESEPDASRPVPLTILPFPELTRQVGQSIFPVRFERVIGPVHVRAFLARRSVKYLFVFPTSLISSVSNITAPSKPLTLATVAPCSMRSQTDPFLIIQSPIFHTALPSIEVVPATSTI